MHIGRDVDRSVWKGGVYTPTLSDMATDTVGMHPTAMYYC